MSDIYGFPEQDSKSRFRNLSGPKGWVFRDLNDSVLLFAEVPVIDNQILQLGKRFVSSWHTTLLGKETFACVKKYVKIDMF